MTQSPKFWTRPLFWLTLCVLLSFLALAYPLYVIRPFRYQGPSELKWALAIIHIQPVVELVLAITAVIAAVLVWREHPRVLRKVTASVCALLALLFAFLSRVNIYELMFHPMDAPAFSPAANAKLDGGEEVIAIREGSAARAYPVRIMSYHHIVNDVVGGIPIVATY